MLRIEILILNKKKISFCDLVVKLSYMIYIIIYYLCNLDIIIMRFVLYVLCLYLLFILYMLGRGIIWFVLKFRLNLKGNIVIKCKFNMYIINFFKNVLYVLI